MNLGSWYAIKVIFDVNMAYMFSMIRNIRAILSILLWLVKCVVMRLIDYWGNYKESLGLHWETLTPWEETTDCHLTWEKSVL